QSNHGHSIQWSSWVNPPFPRPGIGAPFPFRVPPGRVPTPNKTMSTIERIGLMPRARGRGSVAGGTPSVYSWRKVVASFCQGPRTHSMFDLLITGGQVIDGSGNPWFHADVGIRGDRIEEVGQLS